MGLLLPVSSRFTPLAFQRRSVRTDRSGDVRIEKILAIIDLCKFGIHDISRGVKEKRFKSGEQWEVLRREEGAVIVGKATGGTVPVI
jgi:hypothetical protein